MMRFLFVFLLTLPLFQHVVAQSWVKPCLHVTEQEQKTIASFRASYHRFELNIDPAIEYISGQVTTYFEALQDGTTQIEFDLADALTVNAITTSGLPLTYTHNNDKITISWPVVLNSGDMDSVSIDYEGVPATSGFGSFEMSTHGSASTLWTQSEPYGARDWWPCQQDLSNKVDSIDMIVTVPVSNVVASNGILLSREVQGAYEQFHWRHRYPIANYLIAFAVTNYSIFSDQVELIDGTSVLVENYVYPESLTYWMQTSEHTAFALRYFSDKFGDYPFQNEKYGHAQYGASGGMENQTISFMSGPSKSLISHEMAHHWFGDQLTCGSWSDIWLNEGFATYLDALVSEQTDLQQWEQFKSYSRTSVTSSSGGSVYAYDTANVGLLFDYRLVYQKAAMVLHMLRWELGDEIFFAAIQNYATDPNHINGFVRTTDLQNSLEATCDCDLTEFFLDWVYRQGYPSHDVQVYQEGGRLKIEVVQSQSHPSVNLFELTLPIRVYGAVGDSIYRVPIKGKYSYVEFEIPFIASGAEIDPDIWLISANNSLKFKNRSIISELYPNPGQAKFYVNSATQPTRITVSDERGRIVEEVNSPQLLNVFDSAAWSIGTYSIELYYDSGNAEILKYIRK